VWAEGREGAERPATCGRVGGRDEAQQASRGPDHLKVDRIEFGDNNGKLA
jgi:hypothetical protein